MKLMSKDRMTISGLFMGVLVFTLTLSVSGCLGGLQPTPDPVEPYGSFKLVDRFVDWVTFDTIEINMIGHSEVQDNYIEYFNLKNIGAE